MTPGQRRALRELERLRTVDPDGFEITAAPKEINGRLVLSISLRLGPMETREGGLDLREREDFSVSVPGDFPFELPTLLIPKSSRERFGGFPHVVWSSWICLFQSKVEWNPADGLYGFFERLKDWLGRAAINDMDSVEGPLEPPHHIIDSTQPLFVIRCNSPVSSGESWSGLAELVRHQNRVDLVGWNDLTGEWPEGRDAAVAVILPESLPMEFPKMGADFFRELAKQGVNRDQLLRWIAMASILTPDDQPVPIVIGTPMRRAADGSARHHVAVWTTRSDFAVSAKRALPARADSDELRTLRAEYANSLYSLIELHPVTWCRVLEDRSEILVRRDTGRPLAWFADKRVLVLGCGALGSWAAEIVSRARPSLVHLVDDSMVKPGLLLRQNFVLDDIASNKAEALAARLRAISADALVEGFNCEAHRFVTEDLIRFASYDIVIECTASAIFQMKLERDWASLSGRTPPIISMMIDAKAQRCLVAIVGENSAGGVWDVYVRLKHRLCLDGRRPGLIAAFYTERVTKDLFQPEPGCSDPTFSGSTADALVLVSTALNLGGSQIVRGDPPVGTAFSTHSEARAIGTLDIVKLTAVKPVEVADYRVWISPNVCREARGWVRQSNRLRSGRHETGGLLWGVWDDAVEAIWILDASGPPPDSLHDPGHFVCGVEGTLEEHQRRFDRSHGVCGFVGIWHTHPFMPPMQSLVDVVGMSDLVSRVGQNRRRAVMIIFGRASHRGSAGLYLYESEGMVASAEAVRCVGTQIVMDEAVV